MLCQALQIINFLPLPLSVAFNLGNVRVDAMSVILFMEYCTFNLIFCETLHDNPEICFASFATIWLSDEIENWKFAFSVLLRLLTS